MRAEIISVGSELLLGHVVNSDAAIVARELAALGIDLNHIQTVGDNPGRLDQALRLAATRSDIIITTGGLGPTDDDLTKSAIAKFAGAPLVEDPASARRIKEYFGSRHISSNQIKQAYMPKGSVIFANAVGTAPGCALVAPQGMHIIMLPGPPGELAPMLVEHVIPYLLALSSETIYSTCLRVFGMGEGEAAERIAKLMQAPNPTVAPYAHGGEMFVKISAKAVNVDQAQSMCEPVISQVRELLGDVVYSRDAPNLETVLVNDLRKDALSIATAESCTGGLLAKRITDVPGASAVFHLGIVTYSNEAKEAQLGVPVEVIEKYGAVSDKTAALMAENIRKIANADIGLGITGIAGPDGGTLAKPVGLVFIAMAHEKGCVIHKMEPAGRYHGREFTRERACSFALDMARRHLENLPILSDWK